MAMFVQRARKRASLVALLALLPLTLAGCALPFTAARPHGVAVMRSIGCHCRFIYPRAWYYSAANGDYSKPILGLDSYDASSEDHQPVPPAFADVGIDWHSDPIGQLYLVSTTHRFKPWPGHHLTVSGWPATSYTYWTAPPSQGGVYVEHVYFFVPWYQRDYDVWLHAESHPGNNVSAFRHVFARLVRSMTIVPPNVLP